MKNKLIGLFLLVFTISIFPQSSITTNGENTFIKRATSEQNKKFTFAILGDKTNGGELNWPIFDSAVAEINRLRPDFVIMIGDMIQGVTEDTAFISSMWNEFRTHAEKLEVPLYVLPGNHDISNEVMCDYWTEKIGLRYYSFVHKNSLFILLNSEEYNKLDDEDLDLGREQLDFIKKELSSNTNVDQTFIFIHRPLWPRGNSHHSKDGEWQEINSIIKNRKTTLFAGHLHHLLYNEIDGNRHIILSATGGNLTEKPLSKLGYFHHYSIVTVEGERSDIAIIKPGNNYKVDVANNEFISKFYKMIKTKSTINIVGDDVNLTSKIEIKNLLDKNITYSFSVENEENNLWKFENNEFEGTLKPNEVFECKFESTNKIEKAIPLPNIKTSILINGLLADTKVFKFSPNTDGNWRYPESVMTFGGFDLGFMSKPHVENEIKDSQIHPGVDWESDQKFIETKIKNGIKWDITESANGYTKLDNVFGKVDFTFGYIKITIHSETAKTMMASMHPDNYAKVYLNGNTVLEGSPYSGVPFVPYLFLLNLQKGENRILIKTANYFGGWHTDFKISDNEKILTFKNLE